jgi:hypothetical protein
MAGRVRPSSLRPTLCSLILVATAAAQAQPAITGPRIGVIDFYGVHRVPVEKLRKTLKLVEGDLLPSSKTSVEESLEQVPGVVAARLTGACCESGKAILYVGIEEKGGPHFDYHPEPEGNVELPERIHMAYAQFLRAAEVAGRTGDVDEDLSKGHSLFANEQVRAAQERFLDLAAENLDVLKKVVRESADEERRAIAAYVLQYAPDKTKVVNDLQYALQDPDETVRSNAVRALGALAVLAIKNPDAGLKVSPTWFVEMLNSIVWTDRNNAAVVLVNLTENRDPAVLDLLRDRALTSILEMAAWKHLPHALPGFILAGRMAGFPEKEIQDLWSAGQRDAVIRKASGKKK